MLLRVVLQTNINKMSQPGSLSSVPSSSSVLQTENEKDQVKYKGVRKRKWGKWVSEIRFPNSRERIWLGSYDSAEKAARAFDAAQFCLRGKNAKFNFPHDPPDLSGGRSLTPAEIQAIASQNANNYNPEEQQLQQPQGDEQVISEKDDDLQSQMMELEDISPLSSNSDGAFQMDNMNWSFFDMLEPYGTDSNFPDYGLMLSSFDNMHVDMNMSPHLGTNVGDNGNGLDGDEQNADEHYGQEFFLWNF